MSEDTPSANANPEDLQGASATTISSEAAALLQGLRAKQSEFDNLLATATTFVREHIEAVKTASANVIAVRDSVAATQGEVQARKDAVDAIAQKANDTLSEIDNLKTGAATIKGAVEATQQSVAADAVNATNSKVEIERLQSSAAALSEKLTNEHGTIATSISSLEEQKTSLQNILTDLSAAKSEAENDAAAAKQSVQEISDTNTAFVNLHTDTQLQYDALAQRQLALQAKITEIEDANGQIMVLRRALLETSGDTKSIQDQIDELHTHIAEVLADTSRRRDDAASGFDAFKAKYETEGQTWTLELDKKFDILHKTLQDKILSLLPSAGAAGLSSTYYDAKSRYAPTSFAGKPGAVVGSGWRNRIRRLFGYNPSSVVATITFYTMFLVPLAYIVWESFKLLHKMEDSHFQIDFKMLAVRLLIVVPLATISTFGFASLRLYRKLFEEYNHKQRVMELYQSFKQEVDAAGSDEQKKALLTIMLDSVASKAWADADSATTTTPPGLDALSTLERLTDDIAKLKTIVH
ncbi:MAG TPA: hypothetical protein VNX86_15240 [Rhizomicrobium sp.]|jgi:hypothetical protein|nr:hypothetical protein [Rhizomicrobium sp.]